MLTKAVSNENQKNALSLAVNTFGTEDAANNWMNKFHSILGNTPFSYSASDQGLVEVMKILAAISYGGVV